MAGLRRSSPGSAVAGWPYRGCGRCSSQAALAWLVAVALLLAVAPGDAAQAPYARLRHQDLASRVGQRVLVKGRTGVIVEAKVTGTYRVFTLRDDYGDMVEVYSRAGYPIMGATYEIAGIPRLDDAGNPYLEEESRRRAYPVVPPWFVPAIIGLVLAGVLAAALIARWRASRADLAPAWGHVEILGGPDQGKNFALRRGTTLVGRGQDPNRAISIALDVHVSRRHGKITKRGGTITYEDTKSTGGSWVNEEPVTPGRTVPLKSGALLRLGPRTMLRFTLPAPDMQTLAAEDIESADWGEAQTEPADEPESGMPLS